MSEKRVRTRFAPSPTGKLHIGGFRSAFYAWLLARHFQGDFILRIEDTDRNRLVPGAIQYILEGFSWFGIEIDEGPTDEELKEVDKDITQFPALRGDHGPYVQSLRLPHYQEAAEKLVESGHAFRCDCTPEMLEKERNEQLARKEPPGYSGFCRTREVGKDTPHVVRFKMPPRDPVVMHDGIRGRIEWNSIPLRDPVILKGDGFPTYHLASVVDDHLMEISHVMRGEEWIPTAPLHLLLYEALGWQEPIFCHLPVVLGPDGKKLSKRHGATSWSAFRDEGYLPEALLNFIVRIGWSPGEGDEQEIFSRDELIQKFALDHVNSSSGVFEYNKLNWMNGVYIRELQTEDFSARVQPFLESSGVELSAERWEIIAPSVQERTKLLSEVPEMVRFLEEKPLQRELDQMISKKVSKELAAQVLGAVAERFQALEPFEEEPVDQALKGVASELEQKPGAVFLPVRIAVTGKKATPPLFDSMKALGKEETVRRLEEARALLLEN